MQLKNGDLRVFGFSSSRRAAVESAWTAALRTFPSCRAVIAPDWDLAPRRRITFALVGACQPAVQVARRPDGSFLLLDGQVHRDKGDTTPFSSVLQGFLTQGEKYLEEIDLSGLAAAWDAESERFALLRDRFGVVPGYFVVRGDGIAFASSITTLARLGFANGMDEIAIAQFLYLGFFPAPSTPIRGVMKIPPAHTLAFTRTDAATWRHWGSSRGEDAPPIPAARSDELFREKFERALRRRWNPDATNGLLLSGGVDSAMVLAGVRDILGGEIRTFTFRYDPYDGRFNEGPRARAIAAHLRAPHEEIIVSPDQLWCDLDDIVRAYGEPVTWGLHSYNLAPLISAGVDTLFSGAGPDGWSLPRRYRVALGLRRLPAAARRTVQLTLHATRGLGGRQVAKLRRAAADATDLAELFFPPDPSASSACRRLYRDPELYERGRQAALDLVRGAIAELGGESEERILIRLGKRFRTAESILLWSTAWTRAHGLSLQLPYFDRDLVDVVLRLSGSATGKDHVRRLATDFLPNDMASAAKLPQEMPVGYWLRGPLRDRMRARLDDLPSTLSPILNPAGIRRLINDHVERRADHGWMLVALITAAVWCDQLDSISRSCSWQE